MSHPVRKIMLIGGRGFIGGALSRLLLQSGHSVSVMGLGEAVGLDPRIKYFQGNYGDTSFLKASLEGIDEIVLLAYASVPQTSFDDPLADITNNLPPALALFEYVRNMPLKKLVILSSGGTVYGKPHSLPITENAETNPISPYGITKLAIEKYAGMYHHLYGLPAVILRPANAYGEGQRPYTGQGFIATAIASVIEQKEIIMFGEQGTIRDYVHVDDIASAIACALEAGDPGQCYNVGTGRGASNGDILRLIESLSSSVGLIPSVTIKPERHFDVRSNVLDTEKITRTTGWRPQITLEEGLKRAWDWFYAQKDER